MTRYLLDTDTLSRLLREPSGAVARRIAVVGEEALATTPIVAGELRFGARRSGSRPLVERADELLARLQVLPLDDRVASAYAGVRRALEWAGTPIGPNDLWIAAHALAEERVLVTGNAREFGRVAGLDVEDWREAPDDASTDALIERESARRLARLGGSQPDLEPVPRRREGAA